MCPKIAIFLNTYKKNQIFEQKKKIYIYKKKNKGETYDNKLFSYVICLTVCGKYLRPYQYAKYASKNMLEQSITPDSKS